MIRYKFTFTKRFQKHFKYLNNNEKKQLRKKLELLSQNPLHPSLRTKHIQGSQNLFECSVNMDIRIIWSYDGKEIIVLIDTGHHDILYKY